MLGFNPLSGAAISEFGPEEFQLTVNNDVTVTVVGGEVWSQTNPDLAVTAGMSEVWFDAAIAAVVTRIGSEVWVYDVSPISNFNRPRIFSFGL